MTNQNLERATQRSGSRRKSRRPNGRFAIAAGLAVIIAVAFGIAISRLTSTPARPTHLEPVRYIGIYSRNSPRSYSGIAQFAQAIGKQPNLACYYSSWREPFQIHFATAAAAHGAVPLVQLNPKDVSLAAIAAGKYDSYLRSFAAAVGSYHHRVVLSFGHEMNGWWFSWGYRHTAPSVFVAAWRHIVTLFRANGARNVTWLWTINIIDLNGGIRAPAAWWPGASYVTWVGIDGYYFKPSWSFAPLFGPTIKAVRALTRAPILIAETGAGPAEGQPAKIADLFTGTRTYGLLGFVWFDADSLQDWRITSPAAIAAFRRGTMVYKRASS